MAAVCFGEDYNTVFDMHTYLNSNFSEENFATGVTQDGYLLKLLHQVFSTVESNPSSKLLDFGTGPSLYTVFSASRRFHHITVAEYAEQNREELHRWMKADKNSFDWSRVLAVVAKLEGTSISPIASRTRSAIKEVIPCDVTSKDILLGHPGGDYDFIVSVLCLEASCANVDIHREAITKLCSLLRGGGGLFLSGVLGESFYTVGEDRFHALPITKEYLKEALEVCSMSISLFEVIQSEGSGGELSDGQGMYYVHATKL